MFPSATEAPARDGLVIDSSASSRQSLSAMLRDLGVSNVKQAARLSEARALMTQQPFDIVLCDYHFEEENACGQDLLEDLRREQLLPFSTVFVMVTSEATYAKVAEAAEAAMDGYLLKPYSANSLAERVTLARRRKSELAAIFDAIESGEHRLAIQMCQERFQARGEYWLYAARVGAELMMRNGRVDDARQLFEAVAAVQPQPWAKLGIARAQLESGQVQPATRTLEQLLSEQPGYADAFDVMGRAQIELGQFDTALQIYQRSAELTPASISRQQKLALMAFYMNDYATAQAALAQVTALGESSRLFDFQTLALMAMLSFDQSDGPGLVQALARLGEACRRHPDSDRVRRLTACVQVLADSFEGRMQGLHRAQASLVELAAEFDSSTFDIEAAANVLGVLARVRSSQLPLPDAATWVLSLAQRFCVSKAACEMLARAVSLQPDLEAVLREGYAGVSQMAHKTLAQAMAGKPAEAIKTLMAECEKTFNAKLLDLADLLIARSGRSLPDAEAWFERAYNLKQRYCRHGTQVKLGGAGQREPGSIRLRGN